MLTALYSLVGVLWSNGISAEMCYNLDTALDYQKKLATLNGCEFFVSFAEPNDTDPPEGIVLLFWKFWHVKNLGPKPWFRSSCLF